MDNRLSDAHDLQQKIVGFLLSLGITESTTIYRDPKTETLSIIMSGGNEFINGIALAVVETMKELSANGPVFFKEETIKYPK